MEIHSFDQLHEQQCRIASAMIASADLNADDEAIADLNRDYAETVQALSELLGPNAQCAAVDRITWTIYEAMHREDKVAIPRRVTLAEAREYLGDKV